MTTATATPTAAAAPDAPIDPAPAILTKADRCEQRACPAQAFVRVYSADTIEGRELVLDFCGHHFVEQTTTIAKHGWRVHDERHRINERPSPSANEHGN